MQSYSINLLAEFMAFLNFAFLHRIDTFPTPTQVLKYLQDYCEHYELLQHVILNHGVDQVSLKEGGLFASGWLQ